MTRRLIVLRHAKSAWNTDAPTDHDRPLNKRGRRDAPRIGARLAELGWLPERVISSDAARTRETWKRLSSDWSEAVEVSFTRALYGAGYGEVQSALGKVDDEVTTAMVIGHNPGWEELVETLTGADHRLTTCNAALLTIEADSWKQAMKQRGCWQLHQLLRPKEL
ncbi:MAG: histidine phosphatase family protein [Deltaproteobacteria bacterium]|nr:histidine phosphatase family protein [Deltaproteobacteria bacterium]